MSKPSDLALRFAQNKRKELQISTVWRRLQSLVHADFNASDNIFVNLRGVCFHDVPHFIRKVAQKPFPIDTNVTEAHSVIVREIVGSLA